MQRQAMLAPLLALLLLLLFCSNAHAARTRGASGGDSALKAVVAEGLVIAASYAAAERPREFAATSGLLIPYAAALDDQSSTTTKWIGVIIAESMAVYNYRAGDDSEEIDRDEIRRKNFIGWNLFAVAVALSEKLTNSHPDNRSRSRFSYSLYPYQDGQTLQMSYRF
jgi:hypothetical protein